MCGAPLVDDSTRAREKGRRKGDRRRSRSANNYLLQHFTSPPKRRAPPWRFAEGDASFVDLNRYTPPPPRHPSRFWPGRRRAADRGAPSVAAGHLERSRAGRGGGQNVGQRNVGGAPDGFASATGQSRRARRGAAFVTWPIETPRRGPSVALRVRGRDRGAEVQDMRRTASRGSRGAPTST